ncbi:MAG: hypothetical protein AAGF85_05680 [Bacteroidota bacterium]
MKIIPSCMVLLPVTFMVSDAAGETWESISNNLAMIYRLELIE